MSHASAREKTQAVSMDVGGPQLLLPDANSTAEVILTQAIEYCAQKTGSPSFYDAVAGLKQGDSRLCNYCRYSVAKQTAEALAALDGEIKAAYICDYDATSEDVCFSQDAHRAPIHMILWVERKTGALASLIEAVDRALSRSFCEILGKTQKANTLDVQVVDDADVARRAGYGAMLCSVQNPPIKVWER